MVLPEDFIKRIRSQEYIDGDSLVTALCEASPVSIRLNTSKFTKVPASSEPVPWCRNGFYLPFRPSFTFDPLFHAGCYYPQEASGMILEQVISSTGVDSERINVLDLCGAPGGKSTHLSELIGTDSLLVSNEAIRSRAVVLAETITKWGTGNTVVTQSDPAAFKNLPGFFDIILVDAPCSGEGMFRSEIAVNEWSPESAAHCALRQKRILSDVWPALKENGVLVYSTCTFNPAENEENARWIREQNETESIRMNIEGLKGITEIDFNGIYGYGFHPGRIKGEGFFISALRKLGSTEKINQRNRQVYGSRPGKKDMEMVSGWTDFAADRIIRKGDDIIAIPCDINTYSYLQGNLRIIRHGTRIGTSRNDDKIPSHELALSAGLKKGSFPELEIPHGEAVRYLRRENITPGNIDKGWHILTYNGIRTGFIKNIGNRINNYYPVEWRIRMREERAARERVIEWIERQGY